jgi:hypothetical protein
MFLLKKTVEDVVPKSHPTFPDCLIDSIDVRTYMLTYNMAVKMLSKLSPLILAPSITAHMQNM